MGEFFAVIGYVLFGIAVGGAAIGLYFRKRAQEEATASESAPDETAQLSEKYLAPTKIDELTVSERKFPFRVRVDLQQAIAGLIDSTGAIAYFCGVRKEYAHESVGLNDCLVKNQHSPVVSVPPQYEEVDIGNQQPVRCLKNGLWFLEQDGHKFVVLLTPATQYGRNTGIQFQIATPNSPAGTQITERFFRRLQESVLRAESYRGKILSLERDEQGSYTGASTGIRVHQLRTVEREQVILPRATLELLERNVIQFVQQRQRLTQYRQSTKKGILFYGPPGTGKTHTIHYLAKALPGHTTLLITAEQVGLLSDYMSLARLLQPSIVVLEDVDLIGRNREQMGVCEEVTLNKLLNEMDGLNEEADIIFLLTTNRPEALEAALASRPGRIDQAIEFPLPDDEGRGKLVRLYSQGIGISDDLVEAVVQRTENVSAAFIKELMRRSVQFHLEQNDNDRLTLSSVEQAINEMLWSGGSLNLKLLGATGAKRPAPTSRTFASFRGA